MANQLNNTGKKRVVRLKLVYENTGVAVLNPDTGLPITKLNLLGDEDYIPDTIDFCKCPDGVHPCVEPVTTVPPSTVPPSTVVGNCSVAGVNWLMPVINNGANATERTIVIGVSDNTRQWKFTFNGVTTVATMGNNKITYSLGATQTGITVVAQLTATNCQGELLSYYFDTPVPVYGTTIVPTTIVPTTIIPTTVTGTTVSGTTAVPPTTGEFLFQNVLKKVAVETELSKYSPDAFPKIGVAKTVDTLMGKAYPNWAVGWKVEGKNFNASVTNRKVTDVGIAFMYDIHEGAPYFGTGERCLDYIREQDPDTGDLWKDPVTGQYTNSDPQCGGTQYNARFLDRPHTNNNFVSRLTFDERAGGGNGAGIPYIQPWLLKNDTTDLPYFYDFGAQVDNGKFGHGDVVAGKDNVGLSDFDNEATRNDNKSLAILLGVKSKTSGIAFDQYGSFFSLDELELSPYPTDFNNPASSFPFYRLRMDGVPGLPNGTLANFINNVPEFPYWEESYKIAVEGRFTGTRGIGDEPLISMSTEVASFSGDTKRNGDVYLYHTIPEVLADPTANPPIAYVAPIPLFRTVNKYGTSSNTGHTVAKVIFSGEIMKWWSVNKLSNRRTFLQAKIVADKGNNGLVPISTAGENRYITNPLIANAHHGRRLSFIIGGFVAFCGNEWNIWDRNPVGQNLDGYNGVFGLLNLLNQKKTFASGVSKSFLDLKPTAKFLLWTSEISYDNGVTWKQEKAPAYAMDYRTIPQRQAVTPSGHWIVFLARPEGIENTSCKLRILHNGAFKVISITADMWETTAKEYENTPLSAIPVLNKDYYYDIIDLNAVATGTTVTGITVAGTTSTPTTSTPTTVTGTTVAGTTVAGTTNSNALCPSNFAIGTVIMEGNDLRFTFNIANIGTSAWTLSKYQSTINLVSVASGTVSPVSADPLITNLPALTTGNYRFTLSAGNCNGIVFKDFTISVATTGTGTTVTGTTSTPTTATPVIVAPTTVASTTATPTTATPTTFTATTSSLPACPSNFAIGMVAMEGNDLRFTFNISNIGLSNWTLIHNPTVGGGTQVGVGIVNPNSADPLITGLPALVAGAYRFTLSAGNCNGFVFKDFTISVGTTGTGTTTPGTTTVAGSATTATPTTAGTTVASGTTAVTITEPALMYTGGVRNNYFTNNRPPSDYLNRSVLPVIYSNGAQFDAVNDIVYLSNGLVKYGINLKRGGQLCYASRIGGANVIYNGYDGGFQVVIDATQILDPKMIQGQTSGSPQNNDAYNTTQGGTHLNRCTNVLDHYKVGTNGYFVKIRPMLYPFSDLIAEVEIGITYTLTNRGLKIDYTYDSFRTDGQFPLNPPFPGGLKGWALPVCFLVEQMNRFKYYEGASPWLNNPLTTVTIPNTTSGGAVIAEASPKEFWGLSCTQDETTAFGTMNVSEGGTSGYMTFEQRQVGSTPGTVFTGGYTVMDIKVGVLVPNGANYQKNSTAYVALGTPDEVRETFYRATGHVA